MTLTVLGSGSKGNCYLLHNNNECLILEAGVPFREVLRALKGNIRKIVACLVTHEHQDHAKYVQDFVEHGIKVYMTPGTKIQLLDKLRAGNKKTMMQYGIEAFKKHGEWFEFSEIGEFTIVPFKTVHDAAEPCGFYISHQDTGCVAFITDSAFVPNTFSNVTNMLIECNYDEELLSARTDIPESLKQRIRNSHQSISTCIDAIKANAKGTLHQVVLLHISEGDGDIETFGQRVQEATGISTQVATKGLETEIRQFPF